MMKGEHKMKKRFIRRNFNMVEIMLAVIVIALGITGTFVLFPVGVNANKSAVADNSIADIAEYVTAFARAEVLAASQEEESSKKFGTGRIAGSFNQDGANPAESKEYYQTINVDDPGASWSNSDSVILKHLSVPGVYLVRQLSGPEDNRFVDFAAIARVYLDNGDTNGTGLTGEFFPNANAEMVDTASGDDNNELKKFFIPAVLELSWPATVPIGEREKRYFRFEIFNDGYRL